MKKYLEIYFKKTWKNHGNIMEFCQSEKVGTLDSRTHSCQWNAHWLPFQSSDWLKWSGKHL